MIGFFVLDVADKPSYSSECIPKFTQNLDTAGFHTFTFHR